MTRPEWFHMTSKCRWICLSFYVFILLSRYKNSCMQLVANFGVFPTKLPQFATRRINKYFAHQGSKCPKSQNRNKFTSIECTECIQCETTTVPNPSANCPTSLEESNCLYYPRYVNSWCIQLIGIIASVSVSYWEDSNKPSDLAKYERLD